MPGISPAQINSAPPSRGSPVSEGRGVFHFDDYRIESIQIGIIEAVDTDDDYDDD
jgi:hypothetical protein